jgi:hypothetical protein
MLAYPRASALSMTAYPTGGRAYLARSGRQWRKRDTKKTHPEDRLCLVNADPHVVPNFRLEGSGGCAQANVPEVDGVIDLAHGVGALLEVERGERDRWDSQKQIGRARVEIVQSCELGMDSLCQVKFGSVSKAAGEARSWRKRHETHRVRGRKSPARRCWSTCT